MDKLKPIYAKCIIIMFIIGSTVVMGVSTATKQDAWMVVLIATAYAIPVVLMYARIMKLFPEMGLYDIMESVAGKVGSKVLIALFTWYAFHLGSLVLRNFIEFIQMNVLQETPRIVVMILFMFATSYLVKSGILTMGKLAVLSLSVLLFVVAVTLFGSVSQMEPRYLLPVLSNKWSSIFEDGFNIFTFPFAETVLFLVAASAVRKQDSPYRIYLWGILSASAVLIAIVIRNILILGPAMTATSYFPSYVAARIISIGDFFARIEGSISINFIMSGVIKISVCLFATAEGAAKLAGLENHRRLVLPIALMMMALCEIVYSNLMQMFAWLKIYSFYAIPFQIIFPVLIWILSEIKAHKEARLGAGRAGA